MFEVALLMLAAYFLGALIACFIRRLFFMSHVSEPVTSTAEWQSTPLKPAPVSSGAPVIEAGPTEQPATINTDAKRFEKALSEAPDASTQSISTSTETVETPPKREWPPESSQAEASGGQHQGDDNKTSSASGTAAAGAAAAAMVAVAAHSVRDENATTPPPTAKSPASAMVAAAQKWANDPANQSTPPIYSNVVSPGEHASQYFTAPSAFAEGAAKTSAAMVAAAALWARNADEKVATPLSSASATPAGAQAGAQKSALPPSVVAAGSASAASAMVAAAASSVQDEHVTKPANPSTTLRPSETSTSPASAMVAAAAKWVGESTNASSYPITPGSRLYSPGEHPSQRWTSSPAVSAGAIGAASAMVSAAREWATVGEKKKPLTGSQKPSSVSENNEPVSMSANLPSTAVAEGSAAVASDMVAAAEKWAQDTANTTSYPPTPGTHLYSPAEHPSQRLTSSSEVSAGTMGTSSAMVSAAADSVAKQDVRSSGASASAKKPAVGRSSEEQAVLAAAAAAAATAAANKTNSAIDQGATSQHGQGGDSDLRPASLADAIKDNTTLHSTDADTGAPASTTSLSGLRSVRSRALVGGNLHSGEVDDLKKIRGIGVLVEKKLNSIGVSSFDQIASWTPEDVRRVSHELDFQGRIEREHWVEQAQILLRRV